MGWVPREDRDVGGRAGQGCPVDTRRREDLPSALMHLVLESSPWSQTASGVGPAPGAGTACVPCADLCRLQSLWRHSCGTTATF